MLLIQIIKLEIPNSNNNSILILSENIFKTNKVIYLDSNLQI